MVFKHFDKKKLEKSFLTQITAVKAEKESLVF
jgi:hypothetical protein